MEFGSADVVETLPHIKHRLDGVLVQPKQPPRLAAVDGVCGLSGGAAYNDPTRVCQLPGLGLTAD